MREEREERDGDSNGEDSGRGSRFRGPRDEYRGGGPGGRPGGGRFGSGRGGGRRGRFCEFCADKVTGVDFKDVGRLRRYLSDAGKIMPRRQVSTCARHQRQVGTALKRARYLALLPYVQKTP